MKKGKIQMGFIGCGGIAETKYFPTLSSLLSLGEMLAFCDTDFSKAELAKSKYGCFEAQAFSDYEEMLKLEELDLIYVLTPNVFHAEMTIAALNSGKHVVCEKPMAVSSLEGQAMIKAAKDNNRQLMISYQSRFREDSILIKSFADSGDFGDIYFAKAHARRRKEVPTWGVFTNAQLQGGGPLIDIGSHALDLTLWLMGNFEPASVTGTVYRKMKDEIDGNRFGAWDPQSFQVEDSAFAFITMKNGATVILETSWALNTTDVREAMSSICGTKGGAEMFKKPDGKSDIIINTAKYGHLLDVSVPSLGRNAPFGLNPESAISRECRLTLEALHRGEPFPVSSDEALQVTRILEAIYQSAEQGRQVML